MISLYKDPKGEAVFDKYEPPSFIKTQQQTNCNFGTQLQLHREQRQLEQHTSASTTSGTIDSLKKRIQELECMLVLNQQQPERNEVANHSM